MGLTASSAQETFTGIWKSRCSDYWGVQVRPAGGALYSVTFCGLSGCLKPGEWMPNTRIEGDPMYVVVSPSTIRVKRNDSGYFNYTRCDTDPSWQINRSR